jgi:hypothetical protein
METSAVVAPVSDCITELMSPLYFELVSNVKEPDVLEPDVSEPDVLESDVLLIVPEETVPAEFVSDGSIELIESTPNLKSCAALA